jgi:hypothetical protein
VVDQQVHWALKMDLWARRLGKWASMEACDGAGGKRRGRTVVVVRAFRWWEDLTGSLTRDSTAARAFGRGCTWRWS